MHSTDELDAIERNILETYGTTTGGAARAAWASLNQQRGGFLPEETGLFSMELLEQTATRSFRPDPYSFVRLCLSCRKGVLHGGWFSMGIRPHLGITCLGFAETPLESFHGLQDSRGADVILEWNEDAQQILNRLCQQGKPPSVLFTPAAPCTSPWISFAYADMRSRAFFILQKKMQERSFFIPKNDTWHQPLMQELQSIHCQDKFTARLVVNEETSYADLCAMAVF